MANLQNNKLIDVEQHFWDLLNDYGMTNDQALNVIKEKHGSIGYDHALSLINEQKERNMNNKYLHLHIMSTTIHKQPNAFVRTYRRFIKWLKCF